MVADRHAIALDIAVGGAVVVAVKRLLFAKVVAQARCGEAFGADSRIQIPVDHHVALTGRAGVINQVGGNLDHGSKRIIVDAKALSTQGCKHDTAEWAIEGVHADKAAVPWRRCWEPLSRAVERYPGEERWTSAELLAVGAVPGIGPAMRGTSRMVRADAHAVPAVTEASKSARIYDPIPRSQRPFSADYPDATGQLTRGYPQAPGEGLRLARDIEGRPLVADRVVGRSMVGGDAVALPHAELVPVATSLTGRSPQNVAPRQLRGDFGSYVQGRDPVADRVRRAISLNRNLTPQDAPRVLGHEIGHAISRMAADIPTEGIETKLRQVYNDLNSLDRRRVERSARTGKPVPQRYWTGPEDYGYSGAHISRELMAEAIRAYMTDPNYLKTIAPKVAERIREHANPNPLSNGIIQFNSMLAPLGVPAVAGMLLPRAEENY